MEGETTTPKIEKEEIVTQIRSIEEGKDGIAFITPAENLVLYTDNKIDVAAAKENVQENKDGATRGNSFFVKITYIKSETRNQQLCGIEKREVPQTGVDEEFESRTVNDKVDIEEGEDPDGEAPDAETDIQEGNDPE